jgi:predicted tellurium resistance membrane protein TerC
VSRTVVPTVTALPRSPEQDRRSRMRKYTIAMSVRTVCLIGVVHVPDWWRFVLGAGAVFLPYVAVVLANVGSSGASTPVRPVHDQLLAIEAPKQQPTETPDR